MCSETTYCLETHELPATYQGAVKNTRTGRDRSFERTLSENSCSVEINFPPVFATWSWVLLIASDVDLDGVRGDIIVILDEVDGTKALLVVKDAKRMIQIEETIRHIIVIDDFDRVRLSVRRFRRSNFELWLFREDDELVYVYRPDNLLLLMISIVSIFTTWIQTVASIWSMWRTVRQNMIFMVQVHKTALVQFFLPSSLNNCSIWCDAGAFLLICWS